MRPEIAKGCAPLVYVNGSYSLEQLNRKNLEVIFGNIFHDANFLEEIRLQNELSLLTDFVLIGL